MSDSPPEPSAAGSPDEPAKPKKPPPQGIWRGWVRPLLVVILIVTTVRSSLIDWNDVPTGSMVPTVMVGDRIAVNKLAYGFNLPFNGPVLAVPLINVNIPWPLDFLPGFYWGAPEPNDIVTFWKPGGFFEPAYEQWLALGAGADEARARATVGDGGIRMVKRVVAGPGDVVEMRPVTQKFDGRPFDFSQLVINGEAAVYTDKQGVELTETLGGVSRRVQYLRGTTIAMGGGRSRPFPLQPAAHRFGPYTLGDDEYLMIGDNRDNSQDGRFFGPVKRDQITGQAKFVAVSFEDGITNPAWGRFFKGFDRGLHSPE
ncbi:MAG: signal peptidase I [Planctomycetota bacterium]